MRRDSLLALVAALSAQAPQPGQRKIRRRRARPTRHPGSGLKTRCRTLERFRDTRAILAQPITSRSAIRSKALRAVLRAAGYHVEPMPEVDNA